MRTVTLRELNQHSGRILKEAEQTGEDVLVVGRDRIVARIVPVSEQPANLMELLLLQGRLKPATKAPALSQSLASPSRTGRTSADILREMRDE